MKAVGLFHFKSPATKLGLFILLPRLWQDINKNTTLSERFYTKIVH